MNEIKTEVLERQLRELCNHYNIPENKRPSLEFTQDNKEYDGWYNDLWNEIYIFEGLNLVKATRTLRHEFGHFLLEFRDPKHRYHKREERICKMMERTRLKFSHLVKSKQKSLKLWLND